MTDFQTVLVDIFDRLAERRIEADEERDLIARAQAGDSDAFVTLAYAYAPAMRSIIGQFRRAGGAAANSRDAYVVENIRQGAMTGLAEAINAFDPAKHDRLAAIVRQHLLHHVGEALDDTNLVPLPKATRNRYYTAMREAGGDIVKAAQVAQRFSLKIDTLLAAHAAVRSTGVSLSFRDDEDPDEALARIDAALPLWDGQHPDIEDRVMVEMVFARRGDEDDLTEREAAVLRHAYGFENYGEPQSDGEVAHTLGLTRPTAQRARTAGLKKGRSRLGA